MSGSPVTVIPVKPEGSPSAQPVAGAPITILSLAPGAVGSGGAGDAVPLALVSVEPVPVVVVSVDAPASDLIIVAGEQGPQGPRGMMGPSGRLSAGAFVLDVTAVGVVGDKVFETKALQACKTDAPSVRVHVGCDGGSESYTPTLTVNGAAATLTETGPRWFTGFVDVGLVVGINTLVLETTAGSRTECQVTRLEGGAQVSGVSFGAYPGTQTALKSGDTIAVTVNTDPTGVEVSISGGSIASGGPFVVTNGIATGTLTIGNASSGAAGITAKARNAFGTYGADFAAPALTLDQTYPTFGAISIAYPSGKQALGSTEQASVTCAVTGADAVTYTATGLLVAQGYEATKIVANTSSGYVNSGTNYTIAATRTANNAQASVSTLVKIATTAPTASITSPARLTSSPGGTNHEIRIYPSQALLTAPVLNAPVGAWQGAWVSSGSYWSRFLRVNDADPKGSHTFNGLVISGLAGVAGSAITSGSGYVLGGMSLRTVTFPAFSRVTFLGCAVGDQAKTTASIVGGNTLARYASDGVFPNGFYIANADGSYNPNGSYLGLSDSALAGANTSGTLQASFAEVA